MIHLYCATVWVCVCSHLKSVKVVATAGFILSFHPTHLFFFHCAEQFISVMFLESLSDTFCGAAVHRHSTMTPTQLLSHAINWEKSKTLLLTWKKMGGGDSLLLQRKRECLERVLIAISDMKDDSDCSSLINSGLDLPHSKNNKQLLKTQKPQHSWLLRSPSVVAKSTAVESINYHTSQSSLLTSSSRGLVLLSPRITPTSLPLQTAISSLPVSATLQVCILSLFLPCVRAFPCICVRALL